MRPLRTPSPKILAGTDQRQERGSSAVEIREIGHFRDTTAVKTAAKAEHSCQHSRWVIGIECLPPPALRGTARSWPGLCCGRGGPKVNGFARKSWPVPSKWLGGKSSNPLPGRPFALARSHRASTRSMRVAYLPADNAPAVFGTHSAVAPTTRFRRTPTRPAPPHSIYSVAVAAGQPRAPSRARRQMDRWTAT